MATRKTQKKGGNTTLKRHGIVHYQKMGKTGGLKTKATHGPEYYKEIGKRGAEKRWKKKEV